MSDDVVTSSRSCRGCGTPLRWRRIMFQRPDHYPDWALEAWCPECGRRPTAADYQVVRAEFDAQVDRAIEQMQEDGLRQAVGVAVYRRLSATPATGRSA